MNKEHYADYKWIKVKRYVDDESKSWEERYKSLDSHHLKETTFLIDEVRSLADKLDAFEIEAAKIIKAQEGELTKAKRTKEREDIFRSFLVMWLGFSALVNWISSWFIDSSTRIAYSGWLFIGALIIGGILSFLFCLSKWKSEHAKQ